jgi:hypothetical protein
MGWLGLLNKLLLALGCVLALVAGGLFFSAPSTKIPIGQAAHQQHLPQNPFAQPKEAYDQMMARAFQLDHTPPQVQLPDLRPELLFHGINQRPDARTDLPLIHVGIKGSDEVQTVAAGTRCYLRFDAAAKPSCYRFAPDNQKTNLWFTPRTPPEGPVEFVVGMETAEGAAVTEPMEHALFSLNLTPYKAPHGKWEIGKHRVDTSLLARQRARWYGQDLFLALHGGAEFETAADRERIDFGEAPSIYSCYIKVGESLVWEAGQWHTVGPDDETIGKALLFLRKKDDRLMLFDLWDADGKAKCTLSLMRSKGGWRPSGLRDSLRFVGAKTWSQFVLESGANRIEVAPGDWLLFDQTGLRKLDNLCEIDSYVAGQLAGELMVIDGLERQGGKQVLTAHLFNRTRTEIQEHQIALTSIGDSAQTHVAKREPRVLRGQVEESQPG